MSKRERYLRRQRIRTIVMHTATAATTGLALAFLVWWVFLSSPVAAAPMAPQEVDKLPPVIEEPTLAAPEADKPTEETTTAPAAPALYDVPLAEDVQRHIMRQCEQYEIDPAIILAMIQRESSYKANAIGDSGKSFGLLQIQKRWHTERMDKLGITDLLDPLQNVTVGIDYLAELIGRGRGIEWALMAYNGGPSYANKLAAKGIVSTYAQAILDNSQALELKA